MSDEFHSDNSNQTFADDKRKVGLPKQYKVVLHNDDYTPMDFVVEILMTIFKKNEMEATQIMLNVHNQGKGICGVYSYEIAETKVARVHQVAEKSEYPLKASMEVE